MRLILHLGAYGTDNGLIAGWLARNRAALAAQGVCAPPPRTFVRLISQALDEERERDPRTREEAVLRALGASGARRWMVVSAPGLLGGVDDALSAQGFYVKDVARRMHGLKTLFPRCEITLLLAIRNARACLPSLLPAEPQDQVAVLQAVRGDALPWAQLVAALQRALPEARRVVWRHEHLARVWPDVLANLVGPARSLPPAGLLEFAALGMNAEARLRLQRYLLATTPVTAGQLRRVARVFAAQYGQVARPEPAADLAAWVHVELERLDQGYATEWADIAGQSGVVALG